MAPGLPSCMLCGQPMQVAPAASRAPAYGCASPVEYAGFWLRVAASLIDSLIVLPAIGVLMVPVIFLSVFLGKLTGSQHKNFSDEGAAVVAIGAVLGVFVIGIVGGWLYHAYMESCSWQGTVGKRAVNILVTDLEGRPLTFGRATGRHFAKMITGMIPLGIGWIMAGFTEKRQAIHDMITSCLVVRRQM